MNNVFLIGMPGSGKSAVADVYSDFYGEQSFDTDELIEREYGAISAIFSAHGEQYFRSKETEKLKEACAFSDCFIATGGGLPMREENVRLMKANGKIVYLRTKLETLARRLSGDNTRPLLVGDNGAKLKTLYEQRTPIYESIADIIIDTDGFTPEEIIIDIFREVNRGK